MNRAQQVSANRSLHANLSGRIIAIDRAIGRQREAIHEAQMKIEQLERTQRELQQQRTALMTSAHPFAADVDGSCALCGNARGTAVHA